LSTGEDGVLSRWARRKQQVREEEERIAALAPEVKEEGVATSEGQFEAVNADARDVPPDEETKQRWIEELESIDISTLTYDNDFTMFMKLWVPGPLRQQALRKLWTTNPTLAVLDGLNDYDLDYTDKAMQAGKVVSSYMPGRGYASLEEMAEKVAAVVGEEDGAGEDDVPVFEAEAAETSAVTEIEAETEVEIASASPETVDTDKS
jgi:hypothetical protein